MKRICRRDVLCVASAAVAASGTGSAVAAGGESLWTFEGIGGTESSPTVVDGTVYVGSDDGTLSRWTRRRVIPSGASKSPAI